MKVNCKNCKWYMESELEGESHIFYCIKDHGPDYSNRFFKGWLNCESVTGSKLPCRGKDYRPKDFQLF